MLRKRIEQHQYRAKDLDMQPILRRGRLITEAVGGDSTLGLGGLRLAQVVAWMVLAAALAALELLQARGSARRRRIANTQNERSSDTVESERAASGNRRARR